VRLSGRLISLTVGTTGLIKTCSLVFVLFFTLRGDKSDFLKEIRYNYGKENVLALEINLKIKFIKIIRIIFTKKIIAQMNFKQVIPQIDQR